MSVLISTGDIGERIDGILSDKDISDDDKLKGINLVLQPAFEDASTRFIAENAISKLNQKYKGQYTILCMEFKEPFATPFNPYHQYNVMFGLQISNSAAQSNS